MKSKRRVLIFSVVSILIATSQNILLIKDDNRYPITSCENCDQDITQDFLPKDCKYIFQKLTQDGDSSKIMFDVQCKTHSQMTLHFKLNDKSETIVIPQNKVINTVLSINKDKNPIQFDQLKEYIQDHLKDHRIILDYGDQDLPSLVNETVTARDKARIDCTMNEGIVFFHVYMKFPNFPQRKILIV